MALAPNPLASPFGTSRANRKPRHPSMPMRDSFDWSSAHLQSLRSARNIFAQFERMQKIYAPEPHYYLQSIGVRPGFQGQGLASGLVRPFLDEADSRGISSYTETMTPSNVGLYEHFGFTSVEQYAVPGTELNIWAFYRAARK